MRIGAQFYTLREFCKSPEGLAKSLKKVSDIGYTTVQISGTCPFEPQWLTAAWITCWWNRITATAVTPSSV